MKWKIFSTTKEDANKNRMQQKSVPAIHLIEDKLPKIHKELNKINSEQSNDQINKTANKIDSVKILNTNDYQTYETIINLSSHQISNLPSQTEGWYRGPSKAESRSNI